MARDLNGTTQYLRRTSCPRVVTGGVSSARTWGFTVTFDAINAVTTRRLVQHWTSGRATGGGIFAIDAGFRFVWAHSTTVLLVLSTTALTTATEYRVVVTWDGTTATAGVHIYQNSAEVSYSGSTAGSGTPTNDDEYLVIGGLDTGQEVDGKMSECFEASGAWSSDQALQYTAQRMSPELIKPSSVVAYWPLLAGDTSRDRWGKFPLTEIGSPAAAQHPGGFIYPVGQTL